MAITTNFSLNRDEDGSITITLTPPVSIQNWSLQFTMSKRDHSTDSIITKSAYSGYTNGQSGITINDATQGVFTIRFNAAEVSGRDPGVYYYSVDRVDSGRATELANGYRIMEY